jgi:hypothetical protein
MYVQALDPSNTEAQDDMDTISGLLQQHISKAVGLPGLLVVAAPGECVCLQYPSRGCGS